MLDRDTLKNALSATPECLSHEQLEAYTGAGADKHPHLATCPRCQAELAMMQEFESTEPLAGEGAAVAWIASHLERQRDQIRHPRLSGKQRAAFGQPVASWWARLLQSGGMRILVPSAAMAAIAIASLFVLRQPKEPELRADAGDHSTVYRSQQVQIVGPQGDLAVVPERLEWKAFPGATSYQVQVMEVDRTVLWSTKTGQTSSPLPAPLRAKIVGNKPILWQITALGPQDNVLADSLVERFVYRPHFDSKSRD